MKYEIAGEKHKKTKQSGYYEFSNNGDRKGSAWSTDDREKAFPLVAQTLRPEMFYHEKEQTLYAVLENMHRNNEPIDILTVKEALQKRGKLDEAGGAYGIVRLSSKVTSSAHIELHAELIKDRYLRRELIVGINSLTSRSEDPTYDIEDILNVRHLLTDRIENKCSWT